MKLKYLISGLIVVAIGLGVLYKTGLLFKQHKLSPEKLPGKGMEQYDFFYAGESKKQNMYIVRKGQIVWSYSDTAAKGEISDAVLMSDGNVLFAHQYGVSLINADKKLLWHYDAPAGHEVHTAQPIGTDHVVFVQNGDTARVIVMNIVTGVKEKEFTIPVGNPAKVHPQFRHARLTNKGTLLVTHMDMGKVCEYDINGKQLSSFTVPGVWGAEPLDNGNILTCGGGVVREITPKGDTSWIYALKDIAGYTITSPQLAVKRPDGNIVVNDWFDDLNRTIDNNNLPVQFIELTPDKKIVWALRSWNEPFNLGPATIIQFLDNKRIAENVFFGDIK
jgi:outer membrane protein assembly factor BamB